MELTDILSKEEWSAFEKELYDRFHINCTVYNTSGIGVTGTPNWCNPLCPKIKANKDALAAICAPGNQNFMALAKNTGKPVIDECDAGLIKIAVPIFVDGAFLGTAGGCGLLPEGGEVETYIIEKTTGMSEAEIAELGREVGTMTQEQAEEMASFIEARLTEFIAKKNGGSVLKDIEKFMAEWSEDPFGLKPVFGSMIDDLKNKADIDIEFHPRPGITYSVRGLHKNDTGRPLFVMIDVIDDDPNERWLSVCFYGDTIQDPEEKGDLIPEGLLGEDGYCFDLGEPDEGLAAYVRRRIQEAYEYGKTDDGAKGR